MLRPLLIAALLVFGAAFAWIGFRPAAPLVSAAQAPAIRILVATQPLQAGTLLKDADFKERDVGPNEIVEGSVVGDANARDELRGAMLRHYLDANEAVHHADILRPRDRGFLAAVLAPGTRAVSIGVDATTGASGLISPGDLVDVLLVQEFARGEAPAGHRVVAENVLNKVRVIAVDQQIAQGAPTTSVLPSMNTARVASTVSLQVTPEQAAKVVVAGRLGRLTLVVRSIDGDQSGEPSAATSLPERFAEKPAAPPPSVFGSDVSAALSSDEPTANRGLRLIQGDAVNDVVFR